MNPLRGFTRWLGRLSVGRKLTLIYLLDLSAVIYVCGILIHEKFQSIDFTRKEIVGIEYSVVVRDLLLAPFEAAAPTPPQRAQMHAQLARQRAAHDEVLKTGAAADAFEAALARVEQGPGSAEATRRLLRNARELLTTVGNQSNLILDPDLDSYYAMSLVVLRFPELLEVLHDTVRTLPSERAVAAGSVDRRTELLILAGRLDAVALGIRSDYTQAFAAGTAVQREALGQSRQALLGTLQSLLTSVQRLADSHIVQSDLALLRAEHAATLAALGGAWSITAQDLERLLRERVDLLFSRMWLHLGTALLLLGCILSLVYAVAQQIAQPLRRLAGVADAVRRTGDHALRAHWHSRDEIGQLVTAFNQMLTDLDAQRLVQQDAAASARAAQAQQMLVEAIPIALVVTSVPHHDVLHANAAAQPWLGGRSTDPWRSGLEPGVRQRFFQHLADRGVVDEFEVRWLGGEEPSWAVLSARRLQFRGRDAVVTAFTPINVIKLMERRLELWAKVFEASSEGIVIMDAQLRILSANRAFCRSTSYDFYEVIGEQLSMLLAAQGGDPLGERIARTAQERDAWQGEVQFRKRSGETYPAWLMISAVRDATRSGAVTQYIGIAVDISDRKRTEARVQFLAHHDVLTELPNRSLCVERLGEAIAHADATGEQVAVLFIDLDRFKTVNDTLGHHIGDGVLRSVAQRLTQAVRTGDTVSRLGGDEYVVIMRNIGSADELRQAVERRLIPLIRQPHHVEGHALHVSCSVGVALYPQDGSDLDALMRRADAAMYEAKGAGRDAARFYEPAIEQLVQQRLLLEQQLRHALQAGELSLHYQPRVRADGHGVVGVEALLRWHNAVLGEVPPAAFIPVAEETGLIRPIGAWVIEQACAQLAAWARQGLTGFGVSVNLSSVQLSEPGLVEHVRSCIAASGIAAHALEIEITESLLMDNAPQADQQLAALKGLGVGLAIDDFGTGYSSLAYLKRFAIDKLKIDQSFVRDMLTDPTDLAIVRAIVALAHTLGLQVVAEGVETGHQAAQLASMACDELQGYCFARPMPAVQLERWLRTRGAQPQRRRAEAIRP